MASAAPRHRDGAARHPPPVHRPHHDAREDDDGEDEEDDDDDEPASSDDETNSNYSSVSEDSLPPIHRFGHTYHGSGRLYFPNDASEAKRMALQHEMFKLCLSGALVDARLPLEPVSGPGASGPGASGAAASSSSLDDASPGSGPPAGRFQILDVGAGSGIWACEMAQTYPQADILGIDLSSALLPKDVPPNLTFEIADAAEPWPPRLYDLVHIRNLVGGGIRDWDLLLRRALAHVRPGGYLEFTEMRPRFFDVDPDQADLADGERPEIGAACLEFETAFVEMSARTGIDFDPLARAAEVLRGFGATAVRERVDWLPVKSWGRDPIIHKKGKILSEMLNFSLETQSLMLFGDCGWSEKDTRALMARVRDEIHDPKLRSYVKATFLTARKPLDDDESGQSIADDMSVA